MVEQRNKTAVGTAAPGGAEPFEELLADALRALELIRTEKLSNPAYANAVGIARIRLDAALASLRAVAEQPAAPGGGDAGVDDGDVRAQPAEEFKDAFYAHLHAQVGICGHCGKKKCAGRQSHSVLPRTILLGHIDAALDIAAERLRASPPAPQPAAGILQDAVQNIERHYCLQHDCPGVVTRKPAAAPAGDAVPVEQQRLFIDCEFHGGRGDLISMALVSDDGREFYEVVSGPGSPSQWVRENVMPVLNKPRITMPEFYDRLFYYLDQFKNPIIVADHPADIGYFAEAMITDSVGSRYEREWSALCLTDVRYNSLVPHNALEDARAIRRSAPPRAPAGDKALLREVREAINALLVMGDRGPQPKKFDEALSWRENDVLAHTKALAAVARIDAALALRAVAEQPPAPHPVQGGTPASPPVVVPTPDLGDIRGALARGYCSDKNSSKVLDPALIDAMSVEVLLLLARTASSSAPPAAAQAGSEDARLVERLTTERYLLLKVQIAAAGLCEDIQEDHPAFKEVLMESRWKLLCDRLDRYEAYAALSSPAAPATGEKTK